MPGLGPWAWSRCASKYLTKLRMHSEIDEIALDRLEAVLERFARRVSIFLCIMLLFLLCAQNGHLFGRD